ncbi:uncharacterized protein LOC121378462 isoform X2 [Gigantopelta aegis]|nr:uncharacterized protein LOC121378462 isoform X2 [Gigantopelta aegis]
MSDLTTDALPSLTEDERSGFPELPQRLGVGDNTVATDSSRRKAHWLASRESSVDPELEADPSSVDPVLQGQRQDESMARQLPIQESTNTAAAASKRNKYDVAILCHYQCHEEARTLRDHLKTLDLSGGPHHSLLNVTLAYDCADAAVTEIENLNDLILNIPCILLLIEKTFFTDSQCMFEANVSQSSSLIHNNRIDKYVKKEFVIPIFMKPKEEINGITPSISAMTGIKYHRGWDDTKEIFKRNIETCLSKEKDGCRVQEISEYFKKLEI